MKVAVIGANGQLGTDLCRVLAAQKFSVVPLTHRDVDVSDSAQVDRVLSSIHADVVISTAAFHKVDESEKQPAQSFAVKAVAPRTLALAGRPKSAVPARFNT